MPLSSFISGVFVDKDDNVHEFNITPDAKNLLMSQMGMTSGFYEKPPCSVATASTSSSSTATLSSAVSSIVESCAFDDHDEEYMPSPELQSCIRLLEDELDSVVRKIEDDDEILYVDEDDEILFVDDDDEIIFVDQYDDQETVSVCSLPYELQERVVRSPSTPPPPPPLPPVDDSDNDSFAGEVLDLMQTQLHEKTLRITKLTKQVVNAREALGQLEAQQHETQGELCELKVMVSRSALQRQADQDEIAQLRKAASYAAPVDEEVAKLRTEVQVLKAQNLKWMMHSQEMKASMACLLQG